MDPLLDVSDITRCVVSCLVAAGHMTFLSQSAVEELYF